MRCPYCSHSESKVIETRESFDSTRRRRECLKCKKRFTTYERVEMVDLVVVKKDKRREQFNHEKLMHGIQVACEKRPISTDQIKKIVFDIESDLRRKESTETTSKEIGEMVMDHLKKLDKIAYIRYASVYRDFTHIRSFQKELDALKKKK